MLLPGVIANLKATAATGSVTLTWTAATGASSYRVEYATSASGPYTAAPSVTTNQATIDNLTGGQEYWFAVQAVNAFGTGVVSPQLTATIPGIVPLLTWVYLNPIPYGTPLTYYDEFDGTIDPTNGISEVPGTYVYTPGAGTVLAAGTYTLSVTFTPTSPSYAVVTKSVPLTVTAATLSNSNNFGSIALTQEGNAQAILISFTGADTITSIQTLNLGATNGEFQSVPGGTCVVGQAYPANGSCTVLVTFTPQVTGTRRGAVVVRNKTSGWTTFIYGTGTASQITFDPGTDTTITTSESASNIHFGPGWERQYVLYQSNRRQCHEKDFGRRRQHLHQRAGQHYWTIGGGWRREPIRCPSRQSVCALAGQLYRIPRCRRRYGRSVGHCRHPTTGNRYIADSVTGTVYESKLTGGGISTFLSGSVLGKNLNGIGGLAVDGAGSVYLSDTGNARVLKIQQGSATAVGSGYFKAPYGMAVGGNGDLFVADSHAKVVELTPPGYVITNYNNSALGTDVSIDGYEDILVSVAGPMGRRISGRCEPRQSAHIRLCLTRVGSTSSDSPKVLTITDMGNETMVFPAPANNNSGLTKGFNLANTTTCPDEFNPGTPGTTSRHRLHLCHQFLSHCGWRLRRFHDTAG